MPSQLSLNPILDLVNRFNETAIELNALMNWASNMQPSGLSSTGAPMTKGRLTKLRKMVRELEKSCKPARAVIQEIKESGHFQKNKQTPLYFGKAR